MAQPILQALGLRVSAPTLLVTSVCLCQSWEWVWASDHMEARSWVFLTEIGRDVDRDLDSWRSKESDQILLEPWSQDVLCVRLAKMLLTFSSTYLVYFN